jgi:hypothetical protein
MAERITAKLRRALAERARGCCEFGFWKRGLAVVLAEAGDGRVERHGRSVLDALI